MAIGSNSGAVSRGSKAGGSATTGAGSATGSAGNAGRSGREGSDSGASAGTSTMESADGGVKGSGDIGSLDWGNAIVGKESEEFSVEGSSGVFSVGTGCDFTADRSIGVPSERQVASLPCFKPFE